ncbi:MAG: hypothetical protein Ta2E_01620 [Mycoplasmoidaceae bacterium]|nr:MAG: hypothetical protein Ta2E_01620 [Mycoplasmoidaceae bacterium]
MHTKCNINERIVELDVNNLCVFSMAQIDIIAGKPKVLNFAVFKNVDYNVDYQGFIIEVEVEFTVEKY